MEVQINAPHGNLPADNVENLRARIVKGLDHFESKLTRVEVFLKDVNGHKGGVDTHCSIEARPRGQKPVGVSHEGEKISDALEGALQKLQRSLDNRFGKLDSRKHTD